MPPPPSLTQTEGSSVQTRALLPCDLATLQPLPPWPEWQPRVLCVNARPLPCVFLRTGAVGSLVRTCVVKLLPISLDGPSVHPGC